MTNEGVSEFFDGLIAELMKKNPELVLSKEPPPKEKN